MNQNLLDLVNDTLMNMNSNQVTTVTQTIEAQQVALIAKDTYEYLEELQRWDHKLRFSRALAAPDIVPFGVGIPDGIQQIKEVRYLVPKDPSQPSGDECWKTLTYMCPTDFLDVNACEREDTDLIEFDDVDPIWPQGFIDFWGRNNKEPDSWTVIDESYMYFDSYNSSRQAAIDNSEIAILAYVKYTFDSTDDTYEIEIPDYDWSLYKNMVYAKSWLDIKQQESPTAGTMANRLLTRSHNKAKRRVITPLKGINYGR